MFEIQRTAEFSKWFDKLKDPLGKTQISRRLNRAAKDENFGNKKDLGGDLFEMKFETGPGYRLYLTQIDGKVYLLLCGGDKSSQNTDIDRARSMIATLKKGEVK